MSEGRTKTLYITCIKLFATLLVTYGHFISVGTYSTEVPGVIFGSMSEPLIPATSQILWKIESIMYQAFHIEFAVVGVVLFFLASGYFIPKMQEKYNSSYLTSWKNFPSLLFSRLMRLYPTLIICVLLNGLLAYFAQGIRYNAEDYVGTALLLLRILPVTATMEVVWYLLVLVFAYFIATVVPRLTVVNLTAVYSFLLFSVLMPYMLGDTPITWMAQNLGYLARYTGIILLGTYAALSKKFTSELYRAVGFAWYFCLTILLQKVDEALSLLSTTYAEINTYLLAFLIIAVFFFMFKVLGKYVGEKAIQWLNYAEKVSFAFYLVHVHFGLIMMYFLKKFGVNAYLNLACAYLLSTVVAVIVTKIISGLEKAEWYKKIALGWIS